MLRYGRRQLPDDISVVPRSTLPVLFRELRLIIDRDGTTADGIVSLTPTPYGILLTDKSYLIVPTAVIRRVS